MLVRDRLCRVCRWPLQSVLDLGNLALSTFPHESTDLPTAPLDLCRCPACGLVQLRHTVEPDALFRQYWYRSGVNETMRAELADIVVDAMSYFNSPAHDCNIVVDVGANDGTLLQHYPHGPLRVAYEPANNLQSTLSGRCDILIPSYFPDATYGPPPRSVSILTSIACFYATDNPTQFVCAVDDALAPDGIWIVQFQDLHQLLQATAFDDICHEHLFYPCLASVERLTVPLDLHIIDAQRRDINGGSLRLTLGRRWRSASTRVASLRAEEAGCEDFYTLRAFADKVRAIRDHIRAAIHSGGIVDLYGASTKANTLLQFCGLGPADIRQAWERSPEKWGRYTVTGIPIVSEEVGRAYPPDLLFVGIWQFRDAIIKREAEFLKTGRQLLFPLPSVSYYSLGDSSVL